MKTNKKRYFAVFLFALLSLFCFALAGCGDTDKEQKTTIKIEGAYDFSYVCELKEKTVFSSAQETADTVNAISGGAVKSQDIVNDALSGGAIYSILIKDVPEGADVREYFRNIEDNYLTKFSSWKSFPNSPVKYTTKDGKDVLVYVSTEKSEDHELLIYVFFFNAGSVDALAENMGGGSGGNGGNSGSGGTGNTGGEPGEPQDTVTVNIIYNGTPLSEPFIKGSIQYFAQHYSDMEVSLNETFYPLLNRDEPVTIEEGLTIFVRPKQQTPTNVSVTVYDVDKQGNTYLYTTEFPKYNTAFKFCYYGFVLYWDEDFKQEIDPNQEIVLTQDTVVYRRDNYDRVPVFFNVHYYTNGVEENIGANDIFFRGELLSINKNFISKSYGYEFYYDKGKTQKVFEGGNVIVVRETDDKKNIYGFREDSSTAVLTFMLGGNELCKELISVGATIGDYHYLYLGNKTYWIKDCTPAKDQQIRGNTTVTVSDCEVTNNYTVTIRLCYNGDVKRTFFDYIQIGSEGWEISESAGYYTDVNCTQPFIGTISSATTLYSEMPVNFGRIVDSSGL